MADVKDIVKLAVDSVKGQVTKYSTGEAQNVLREALIEANNGKTTLDYKDIRDGKCNGLFALVEEVLGATVIAGLEEDDFFTSMVEFKDVAFGDENIFKVEDGNLYIVAEISDGNQGIRRQRLGGTKEVPIPTQIKAVRIYEELSRVLSGRVDFVEMVERVAVSFREQLMNDIYALWEGVTAADLGGAAYFPTAGAYDEDALLEVIAHVEAAAGGKTATIVGTKKALKNLIPSITGAEARSDLYNLGYLGKFYGSPVIAVPQRHKIGSTEFVMDDNMLTIIAGDNKPIKCVREGDPLVIMGDPLTNADLTQEYVYIERIGMGIVLANNEGIGRYEIAD